MTFSVLGLRRSRSDALRIEERFNDSIDGSSNVDGKFI